MSCWRWARRNFGRSTDRGFAATDAISRTPTDAARTSKDLGFLAVVAAHAGRRLKAEITESGLRALTMRAHMR